MRGYSWPLFRLTKTMRNVSNREEKKWRNGERKKEVDRDRQPEIESERERDRVSPAPFPQSQRTSASFTEPGLLMACNLLSAEDLQQLRAYLFQKEAVLKGIRASLESTNAHILARGTEGSAFRLSVWQLIQKELLQLQGKWLKQAKQRKSLFMFGILRLRKY